MNPFLARDVTERVFDQAAEGNARFQRTFDPMLAETIDENRGRIRIRQKGFQTTVNALRREGDRNPAVIQTQYDPGGASRKRNVLVSLLVPMRSLRGAAGDHKGIGYNALGVNHIELAASQKCIQLRHWFSPVQVTAHAIQRHLERCVSGENAQKEQTVQQAILGILPAATLWSALRSSQHDPWDSRLPNASVEPDVVLPHGSGTFCGRFASPTTRASLETGFVEIRRNKGRQARRFENRAIVDIRTSLGIDHVSADQKRVVGALNELFREVMADDVHSFSPTYRRDMFGWRANIDNTERPFSGQDVFLRAFRQVLDGTNAAQAFHHWASMDPNGSGAGIMAPGVNTVTARCLNKELFGEAPNSPFARAPKPDPAANIKPEPELDPIGAVERSFS